jgi:ubiquinone/menaquinone biosynthesis C-methylase UbiE
VDVGGGNGHISTVLAQEFPDLNFEVQDISQTLLTQGQAALTPELQQRIKFNQRDMFKPQPVSDAGKVLAYVLRNVLWNWSDEDCVRLLQTFIPALEKSPETVILVNDGMSPAKGTFEPHVEKAYRRRDVTVMTMHNTKQRTEPEWREVFAKASPHFLVCHHFYFNCDS